MVSLPRTCQHCSKLLHHYGVCGCPASELDAIEMERRAITLRLTRLDEKEATARAALVAKDKT